MRNNIVIFAILVGIIFPFCVSKMYTFSLVNNNAEEEYTSFYLNGKMFDGTGNDKAYDCQFSLSFFSPVVGFYEETYPYDYSQESGTASLLDFNNILNLEFGQEGKKGKGGLRLTGEDKEVSIDDTIVFLSEDQRNANEKALNSIGLSYSMVNGVNSKGFDKSESTLELFKNNLSIKKIFSIKQWTRTLYAFKSKFSSTLCLGEQHSDFSDTDNVGNCPIANTDSPFWNCQFSQMTLNNKNFSLINPTTEKLYEVRFIIESKKIVFPTRFKNLIAVQYSSTGSECYIDTTTKKTELLLCKQMTEDDEDTIPIRFLNANGTVQLKGEIDNENYLSDWTDVSPFPTNIYFDNIDYIVMPLLVFKKFHVLFDGENNKISFFSEDKSLLKLIEQKEEKKETEDETDNLEYFKNHIFTTILIIAIVCLVIGLMVSICCSGKNAPTSIKIEGPVNDDE